MPTYSVTFKEGSKTRTTTVDSFSERDAVETMLQQDRQVLKVSELPNEVVVAPTVKPKRRATFGLGLLGLILVTLGLLFVVYGFIMPTTAPGTSMHNIGMLNDQLVTVIVGCGTAVSGWMLFAAAAIGKEINASMRGRDG